MPSGHAKQEEVCLSSQMEQKGFVEEVVTDLSSEGWGEGSDGWSLQRKGNFTELLEVRALSQTFRVNTLAGVELTASFCSPHSRFYSFLSTPRSALCLKEGHPRVLSFPLM